MFKCLSILTKVSNKCHNAMNNARKFVYNPEQSSKKQLAASGVCLTVKNNEINGLSNSAPVSSTTKMDEFDIGLDFDDDDDITSTMSAADLDRMELEATKKLGLYSENGSSSLLQNNNTTNKRSHNEMVENFHNVVGVTTNHEQQHGSHSTVTRSGLTSLELQQLQESLKEFQSKVKKLESTLCERDGELKILRTSLEKHRRENTEKDGKITQLRTKQNNDQSQRESNLVKEITSLKTRLSFQEEEMRKMESQKKVNQFSQVGGLKRKAELDIPSTSFGLVNSFLTSPPTGGQKILKTCDKLCVRSEISEPLKRSSPIKDHELQTNNLFETVTLENKHLNLVQNLILSRDGDFQTDSEQASLLNILKYPLRQLPELLEAHSIPTRLDYASQFPHWQSQKPKAVSELLEDDETLDLESGKYTLISQGLFMLLGLSRDASNTNTTHGLCIGLTHILVLLELYISSYVRQWTEEKSVNQEQLIGNDTDRPNYIEDQDMISHVLYMLKLVFHAAPRLVKCVIARTNGSFFEQCDDVIIIDDEDIQKTSKDGKQYRENSEDSKLLGSFQSLLLSNFEQLFSKLHAESPITVSYSVLDVLIAMATVCDEAQLNRIFLFLKRGFLNVLLTKDSSSHTILRVITLLKNFLPCSQFKKLLCSHSDSCLLLKLYQCICDEVEPSCNEWNNFVLQVVEFVKSVAFSFANSVTFLLDTDCQCSLEIIRCLVLVLHDKVNYLLNLDTEEVVTDDSLAILRVGITLLVILCTHSSYSPEHKLDVEHHYTELICKVITLYKSIKDSIPEVEALGVQDLLDLEQIEEYEWCLGSEDEEERCMVVDS